MIAITIVLILALVLGLGVYLWRERLGGWGALMGMLRGVGLTALVALLLNPRTSELASGGPPLVLLDASLSMAAAGGRWPTALDTATVLAGAQGTILRFGNAVAPFDTTAPSSGSTRLREAMLSVLSTGSPVYVVSDGEIEDIASLPRALTSRATFVTLLRDTMPNAALTDVSMPRTISVRDSTRIDLTIQAWALRGPVRLTISTDAGSVAEFEWELPQPDGVLRRSVALAPGTIPTGTNVLHLALSSQSDAEPRDDHRMGIVTVSELPSIVVLVAPPDWEGRFLMSELRGLAETGVRGFAHIGADLWVDMQNQERVDLETVLRFARQASLTVLRGNVAGLGVRESIRPTWRWPAASDSMLELFAGDWYVTRSEVASPLAGRLSGIGWDSLPPLTGIVPLVPGSSEWTALVAREGRRGAERPVLLGRDSGGVRQLTTAGAGLWRWALRGGMAREAYRALVAGGIDWLLRAEALRRRAPVVAGDGVLREQPLVFTVNAEPRPETLVIAFASADASRTDTLQVDANGEARIVLDPGVWRWTASDWPAADGLVVVEDYSEEFHLRAVTTGDGTGLAGAITLERSLRQRLWFFFIVVVAFAGEWALRQRRGLP